MSTGTAGFFFVLILAAALAAAYRPLGDYLYLVVNGSHALSAVCTAWSG